MAREGGGVEKPLLPMGVGGGDLQLDFYNLFDIGGELLIVYPLSIQRLLVTSM